jgi:hypothetical protein
MRMDRMRVLLCMLGIFGIASPALADACADALARHHAGIDAENAWFEAETQRAFGKIPKDVNLQDIESCDRGLPIARTRLQMVRKEVITEREVYAACATPRSEKPADTGNFGAVMSPSTLLRSLEAYIRQCEGRATMKR